jgi:hypothetical protein
VFYCSDFGWTMEKVLEEVYEGSDIQPLSKTVLLQEHSLRTLF